jgi:hypothetical protein
MEIQEGAGEIFTQCSDANFGGHTRGLDSGAI